MFHRTTTEVPGWWMKFVANVLEQLPRDIDPRLAREWDGKREALKLALRKALIREGPIFRKDFSENNDYRLVHDVGLETINPNELELIMFSKEDRDSICRDGIKSWLNKHPKARIGQQYAEYLLEHSSEIPEDWQRFKIFFMGTAWHDDMYGRGKFRDLFIYLEYYQDKWGETLSNEYFFSEGEERERYVQIRIR